MLTRIQLVFPIALTLSITACGGGGAGLDGGTTGAQPLPATAQTLSTAIANPYSTAVLADTPTAYYRLDDTTATIADSSGNNLTGHAGSSVKLGATSLITSANDPAISTPGLQSSSGAVVVPQTAKLQPSNAVSVETLLRLATTQTTYAVPVAYGSDTKYAPYDLYFQNGRLLAQFNLNTGVLVASTSYALATNTTYHVVSTFDGTTARLYVNGALAGSASKTGTITGYLSGYGLAIGDDAAFADPSFNGSVAHVAIYAGKALSATQVSNHYHASLGTSTPAPSPAPTASPVATPTPIATPVPVSSSVATYRGCPVFTAGNSYNALAAGAAVDPNSASYINSMYAAGNKYGFYASTGVEKVNLATNSTPLVTVHPAVSWHTISTLYPWLSTYFIEPLADKHAVVVQTQSCHLYESYGTTYSNGILTAYSGADWDMTKPFVPLSGGSPSSMASGLSLFAGAVKWEDYQSGSINHALNWAGIAHTVAYNAYVRPASDTDHLSFYGSGLQLPYGAHLRLKSSVSTSGWGPEATMVANAMKTYGVYLSDTGNSGNAIYFMNAADGSNPWNYTDLSALGKLHITDFDVLTLPAIQHT